MSKLENGGMRGSGQILFTLFLIGLIITLAAKPVTATPWTMPSTSGVYMIDGDDPNNIDVDINIMDFISNAYDFGFVNETGFVQIVGHGVLFGSRTFEGGSEVVFALQDFSTGNIFTTGDQPNGENYCTFTFFNKVPAKHVELPPDFPHDYYSSLNLAWDLDSDGSSEAGYSMAMTGSNDGMYPNPEPSTWLLLGLGLIGLFGMGIKRNRKS